MPWLENLKQALVTSVGSFRFAFEKSSFSRCWSCLFLLIWIRDLKSSLLLKNSSKKYEALIHSMKFFLLRLVCVSTWNIVVMSGRVLLATTWKFSISYKNKYVGLLVIHFLPLLNHRRNVISLSYFYR